MTLLDPSRFLNDAALMQVWTALPEARVVGGAVRDALANRPVADIDLATPRTPPAVMQALLDAGLRAVPTGLSHGTVTAIANGTGFEVTTLRRDVHTDGRHAVVAFTEDWQQDASRRDFTINAMSMGRDGTLFDYFGGSDDLQAGRVRFVGDPARRIAEDYLRILRFFRFQARYGRQLPDATVAKALAQGIPGLSTLSVERVWSEIRLLLMIPEPWQAVALMRRLGIWAAILPEAAADRGPGLPADPILRLAAMLTGDASALAARLKLSNDDRDRLLRLTVTPSAHATDDDATLRRLLADHLPEDLIGRSWLDGEDDRLRTRLRTMPRPVFPLEGRDVLACGVPPGPRVGALLRNVRRWWLAGGCIADADACRRELVRQACGT